MFFVKKRLIAFTLSELMVVFFIIGVIAVTTIQLSKSQLNIAVKYQYSAVFKNLKHAIGEIIVDGAMRDDLATIDKLLPDVGTRTDATHPLHEGLCQRVTNMVNIIGTADCSLTKAAVNPFTAAQANFIASNGVRYFNFGAAPTLDGGGDHSKDYFTVYVDIDGVAKNGTLNVDVLGFKIYRTGQVIPISTSVGGTSTSYMTASLYYDDFTSGNRVVTWIEKSVSFFDASCHAGDIAGSDCPAGSLPKNALCTSNICTVVINSP